MGVKKKLKLTSLLGLSLLIMTACATNGVTSDITAESADFWSKLVYFFAEIIRFLSFDISIGVGIILFTVLIRTVYGLDSYSPLASLSGANGGF